MRRDSADGCLFDLESDPSESVNIAGQKPKLFKKMLAMCNAEAYQEAASGSHGGAVWARTR